MWLEQESPGDRRGRTNGLVYNSTLSENRDLLGMRLLVRPGSERPSCVRFEPPWALAVIVGTLILPVSVFGQSIQQQAAQASQGPAISKRLTVDDAVALALEQNLNLQVQRLDPQLQDLTILQVKTAWTPVVSTSVSNRSATSPVSSVLAGAENQLTNENFGANVRRRSCCRGARTTPSSWSNSRFKSNSVFDSPNPLLQSNVSASYTQPLLRNFKIDGTRQQLLISRKNREITDVQLQQTVLTTTRAVKNAYWDLVFATRT